MPEVAIGVAQCMAAWSSVELMFGRVFVNMIGANKEVGAALWNSLSSERARSDAFRSLCASSLPMADYSVAEATLKMLKSYSLTRHKMAHWAWGLCDNIEDGCIIVDPKHLIVAQGRIGDAMKKGGPIQFSPMETSEIYVYRRRDLDADFRDFNRTGWVIARVGGLLASREEERGPQRDELGR